MRLWELGSDFDLTFETGSAEYAWSTHSHSLWGSGRDAIRGLFEWGARTFGWQRILMPSYFCQDVVEATRRSAEVSVYSWSPLDDHTDPVVTRDGDVVLVSAAFGARPVIDVRGPAPTIEDHSHDLLAPWALMSKAEYAIASLRKTLPLPDGGVVWSPTDLEIPSAPGMTQHHAATVAHRLSAMILKHHYLAGDAIAKRVYRDAAAIGEWMMATGENTGISPYSRARIPTFPVEHWRLRRAQNLETLRAEVGSAPGIQFLEVPFSAILVFEDEHTRCSVREALISNDIYPSVLWPLEHTAVEGIPRAHVDLSRRVLSIHVDHRYCADDMRRVADVLRVAMDAAG